MRSVVVVLPASMCAAIPMFLILSSGTVLGIKISYRLSVFGCRQNRSAARTQPTTDNRQPTTAFSPSIIRESLFRYRLLPIPHHQADEFLHQGRVENRIRQNFTRFNMSFPWHICTYALGRLAPYFDRLCFRLATPAVSSAPRTTW